MPTTTPSSEKISRATSLSFKTIGVAFLGLLSIFLLLGGIVSFILLIGFAAGPHNASDLGNLVFFSLAFLGLFILCVRKIIKIIKKAKDLNQQTVMQKDASDPSGSPQVK